MNLGAPGLNKINHFFKNQVKDIMWILVMYFFVRNIHKFSFLEADQFECWKGGLQVSIKSIAAFYKSDRYYVNPSYFS